MTSGFYNPRPSYRPDFQRTRMSHATDLAGWLAMATDAAINSTTLDALDRRHGGKGGLKRANIESKLLAERERRAART